MLLFDEEIKCKGRSDVFDIYPIGDLHLGSRNCAETPFRKHIDTIAQDENARAIIGGDLTNVVTPVDTQRYDAGSLPDWMLKGDESTIRKRLNDMAYQERTRVQDILMPIKGKILGAIEGNHEFTMRKTHNYYTHQLMCDELGVQDFTDEAILRLRFKRSKRAVSSVVIYICHGWGSGRTAGAEPLKLQRMLDEWEEADVCLRGHSHTFHILPPKPVMGVPRFGEMPKELTQKYRWAANWGSWLYSHAAGESTYDSRACYPARPMITMKVVIKPFTQTYQGGKYIEMPHIELRAITL